MNYNQAMLALKQAKGLGPVLTKRIVDHFKNNLAMLWESSPEEIRSIQGISVALQKAIFSVDWQKASQEEEFIRKSGIQMICYGQENYPEQLKNIYDPPPILYQKGTWKSEDNQSIAIVGTRKASHYALKQAYSFAQEMGKRGITVVSGLARGIDIAAHRGAIAGGGRTIAVLGSGIQCIYPPEHWQDANRIVENGCLVSEYTPQTSPEAFHFPERNRIISGLSLGILVIEAGIKSGAIITAHVALEQGKEIFALPGNIDNLQTQGCHRLIQQGAKLVTNVDEILEEILPLQSKILPSPETQEQIIPVSDEEKAIWEILSECPQPLDTIAYKSPLPPSTTAAKLLVMEMKGIVELFPGQKYARKSSAKLQNRD
ncbi:MAG: DNA-protecting protein DprA [Candidatus Brocadiae bacterium]|nr:DNA-protecting protein DprA [Candidatus Brocadiia bacterium]